MWRPAEPMDEVEKHNRNSSSLCLSKQTSIVWLRDDALQLVAGGREVERARSIRPSTSVPWNCGCDSPLSRTRIRAVAQPTGRLKATEDAQKMEQICFERGQDRACAPQWWTRAGRREMERPSFSTDPHDHARWAARSTKLQSRPSRGPELRI
jgi:hypothetical protein